MNEIIKISNRDFSGSLKNTVNARELHAFLDVNSKFADWIKNRITEYNFIENQDFATFSKNLEKGRPTIEYALSLDMAKELAMLERTAKGRQIRQYFIECEKRLQQGNVMTVPQTLPEALRLAADLADEVALLQPKANALDLLSEKDGDLCLTDAAKNLQIRRADLLAYMQAYRWIYKRDGKGQWIAYQPRINQGFLRHVERVYTNSAGLECISTQVRVTAKGLAHLAQQFSKTGVAA